MKKLRLPIGFLVIWLPLALPAAAATCSSSSGCAACDTSSGEPSCKFVQSNGGCTCDLFVFGGTLGCGIDGECTYTGSGGGTGGGGGGGGGGTCSRLPGGWCPADCTSCETIFWY